VGTDEAWREGKNGYPGEYLFPLIFSQFRNELFKIETRLITGYSHDELLECAGEIVLDVGGDLFLELFC
jgi:hypothetical protein